MIFIIGGAGFVGSAFVRICEAKSLEYKVIEKDNYSQLMGQACDILINANGNSVKFLAQTEPLTDFDASVRSVRASLVDFKYRHYVHLSSCDVYPDCSSPEATDEDAIIDTSRQSPYGFHKYLAELCVRNAATKWHIIRLGGFVGPGLRKNPIFDILKGGPLWLDSESELQYIHTDDAAKIVLHLVSNTTPNQIFNVCGNGVIKLSDFIRQIHTAVPVKPGSPRVRYDVNINKIREYLNIPLSSETVLNFARAELSKRENNHDWE